MQRLNRFLSLPPSERRLAVKSASLLAFFRVALWLTPPRSLIDRVGARRPGKDEGPSPDQIGVAVRRAARHIPGSTCLVQALAASLLLSRAGRESHLRIGVMKADRPALSAHAWVESDGIVVVGGDESDAYHVLPTA